MNENQNKVEQNKKEYVKMSNTDILASSNLLSSLYETYARGLRARVAEGKMTARARNIKLARAKQNIMEIIKEIQL